MRAAMIVLLCSSFSAEAFAWGEEGHAIVAEIAQRRLSPQAAAMVETLLGPGHSLASIASWADDFRANGGAEGKKTASWHFVNIPIKCNDYDAKRDCGSDDPEKGDCIVAELNRLMKELQKCAVGPDQVQALKFVIHLVGDIHQPLHTVNEQGGANGIAVAIFMQGETCKVNKSALCGPLAVTDLHTLWDSTLIRRQYFSWGKYVDDHEDPKTGWLNSQEAQKNVVSEEPDKWAEQWAVETHAKAQSVWRMTPQASQLAQVEAVSTCPKEQQLAQVEAVSTCPNDEVLDDQYLKAAMNIINRQLGVAGLRLAAFLNKAYASCAVPSSAR
jgi:hypothetical protein